MDKRHWAVVAAIAVAIFAALMLFGGPETPPEPEPVAPEPEPTVAPEPLPEPEPEPVTIEPVEVPDIALRLPPLDQSDAYLRDQAEEKVATAEPTAEALETDQLMRKFVVLVENLAQGKVARDPVKHLAPEGNFQVERRDDAIYVSPRSYRRYDRLANVVDGVDASAAAGLLEHLDPLLDEAYGELGLADVEPEQRLREAIDLLLETPVVERTLELRQPSVMFEYADEELESLLPAQKQLLRMGPDNQRKVMAKLRAIREAL